jgi:hypothetical protein
VIHPSGVISYNLDRPAETWDSPPDETARLTVRDVFIGQKFLALLDEPPVVDAAVAPVPVPVPAPAPAPAPNVVPPNPPQQPGAGPAGNAVPPNGGVVAPDPNGATAPIAEYRLQLFRRAPISEKNPAESGILDYVTAIADSAGITSQWQASDGGFYYLTADSKLHLLRGSQVEK